MEEYFRKIKEVAKKIESLRFDQLKGIGENLEEALEDLKIEIYNEIEEAKEDAIRDIEIDHFSEYELVSHLEAEGYKIIDNNSVQGELYYLCGFNTLDNERKIELLNEKGLDNISYEKLDKFLSKGIDL